MKKMFLIFFLFLLASSAFALQPVQVISFQSGVLVPNIDYTCTVSLTMEHDTSDVYLYSADNTNSVVIDSRTLSVFPVSTPTSLKCRTAADGLCYFYAFGLTDNFLTRSVYGCSPLGSTSAEFVQGLVAVVCAALLWAAIILGMRS